MGLLTTTARSWWSDVRPDARRGSRWPVAGLGLALVLAGCVPATPEATEPVVPTQAATGPDAIDEARALIAEPVTEVAAGILDVARRVDFIRHEVARGEAMRLAIEDLRALADDVERRATTLEALVEPMDGVLTETREGAIALVAESRRVTEIALADVDGLAPSMQIDAELGRIIDGWDGRGSRSESEERFAGLLVDADAVVLLSRRQLVQPAACTGPRTNRIRWAELVRSRTVQLRDLALAADGTAYDELRARFDIAPYGEDRVAADAESRACWARESSLLEVPDGVEALLDDVEQALAG